MSWTREQIEAMKELQLQQEVLVPLFQRMGFKDVLPYQGADELGKDIVMWQPDILGERINYAVVAKAKKVDGKATGNSSAANVRFQIEQAFSNPYFDPTTTEEQQIHRCYVVNSHEISTEAIKAIQGILKNNNLEKVTTFIHGDSFWQLLQKHLPERLLVYQLNQANKILGELDPHWRVNSILTEEGVRFSIAPKTPDAVETHPKNITGTFAFNDTPEGIAKREAFEQAIKTGSEVTLVGEEIQELAFPEFVAPLLGQPDKQKMQLTLGSKPDFDKIIIVKVEIQCDDGQVERFDYLPLVKTKAGTEEMTLTNEHQRVPWKLTVVVNFVTHVFNFNLHIQEAGIFVKRLLEGWRFLEAMSKGGTFLIEHLDTGFPLIKQRIDPQPFEPPFPIWMEMLEKLVFIQQKVRIPIVFPARDIPFEEINEVFTTAYKIEKGRMEPDNVVITATRDGVKLVVDHFESGQPFFLRGEQENEIVSLFDIEIPLGPVITTIHDGYLSKEDLAALRAAIEGKDPDDLFPICFKSSKDHPITVEYAKWIPADSPALAQ